MKGYWYDKVEVSIFLCNKTDAYGHRQLLEGRGHCTADDARSSADLDEAPDR